jgi:hypothetical protein
MAVTARVRLQRSPIYSPIYRNLLPVFMQSFHRFFACFLRAAWIDTHRSAVLWV